MESHESRATGEDFLSQKIRVLPGADINPYITAVYESGGGGEVNSKAFRAKHIVTNQHISLQSVNQVQFATNERIDFTAFFLNTRDVDCHESKLP